MATTPRSQESPPTGGRRVADLIGLGLFFGGAACLLWLTWRQNAPVPGLMEHALRLVAGSGAYVIPVLVMWAGAMFLVGYERFSFSHSTWGSILAFVTFVTWRHVASSATPGDPFDSARVVNLGGYLGACVGWLFVTLFSTITTYVFLVMMACMALVLLVDRPFIEMLRSARKPVAATGPLWAAGAAAVRQGAVAARARLRSASPRVGAEATSTALAPARKPRFFGGKGDGAPAEPVTPPAPATKAPPAAPDGPGPAPTPAPRASRKPSAPAADSGGPAGAALFTPDEVYQLPPLTLLREPAPAAPPKRMEKEHAEKQRILEQTLEQFGYTANVVEIAQGPTVTRYELQLAPGIKVSKIVSLADNLAMALAAIDVRVEAPIPGKSAIGVEVPNSTPTMVTLRECLASEEFRKAPGKLTFVLGRDVAGQLKFADLTRMPHLLIGGSTNSGKSVALNALIGSIVYRATPREVKFLMIDPKRVELSLWDGIPHLIHPVVKNVKMAAGIFRAAIREMESRYERFSEMGTRNIEGYNQRVEEEERLPYIVIIVDELADLMMQAQQDVEGSIGRLAQLARATGIHLVIATQRPSVDVITGTIKSNISSRIAFAVSSQVDSRTIIDAAGADRLLGRGDMLYLPIDASKPVRIQGCYLSEQETDAIVTFLKGQERPDYTLKPVEAPSEGDGDGPEDEEVDPELYQRAVRLVVREGQASASMIQRRFKIGYNKAAGLMEAMQQRGVVGPPDGARPREILVSLNEVEAMFGAGLEP